MLKEFKEFALKGNAVDLAIGVIIGARVRRHRDVAGERRDDAADRQAARRRRLLESLRRPRRRRVPEP